METNSMKDDHISQGGIIDISTDGGGEQRTQFGAAPGTPWKRMEVIGDATLYLGDCMDIMRDMPDKAFDLAIVDPPYGDGGGGQWENRPRSRFGGLFDKYSIGESTTPTAEYLRDMPPPHRGRAGHGRRSTKPKGVALAIYDIGMLRHHKNILTSFSGCQNIRLYGAVITSPYHHIFPIGPE